MKRRKHLTTSRAAEIYTEMISVRREFCSDEEFIKASDIWEELFSIDESWKRKTYRNPRSEDYKLKAGVVVFENNVTMTVEESFWEKAKRGGWAQNFVLAHELSHVALGHHQRDAVIKNFQVFPSEYGLANIPPTLEEEEANYAAVFLQCGIALEDPRWQPVELARRAFSDPWYVKKAQRVVRLDVFQDELRRLKPKYPRVIL